MKELTVGELREQLKGLPANLPVVTSSDDEGNSYRKIYYGVTAGYICDWAFVSADEVGDEINNKIDPKDPQYKLLTNVRKQILNIKDKGEPCVCVG